MYEAVLHVIGSCEAVFRVIDSIPNADGDFEYEENFGRSTEFDTHYDFLLPMNCESVNQRYCNLRRQPRVVLFNKGSVFEDREHLAYLLFYYLVVVKVMMIS